MIMMQGPKAFRTGTFASSRCVHPHARLRSTATYGTLCIKDLPPRLTHWEVAMSRLGALEEPAAAEKTRIFTPVRIVALTLCAVLVFGFLLFRFAPEGQSVSVPQGARVGDLILKPCSFPTEAGSYAADCGTLVVPENRADAQSRLIALPVTRIPARSDQPGEPIFVLQGGPGHSNMTFDKVSRYAGQHDVVLVGYRGVDGSVRLDCPEVESALRHTTDLISDKAAEAYADAYRSCANRLANDGIDLGSYGIAQQIDDMEAARAALGYSRINLLSESAGTRTAIIYSWRYPNSIHRSFMVGVNPPGHFLFYPGTTDEQIGRYAALCAKDASCRARTNDLAATIRQANAEIPDRWLFLPIKKGNVRIASFFGLMESVPAGAPYAGPTIIDMWLSATEGDASGLWAGSFIADVLFAKLFVWGQYAAFGRADAQVARDYFSSGGPDDGTNLGRSATTYVWGGGRLADAWPAAPDENLYSKLRTSKVETLLVGGELDFSTPPQVMTKELLPYLPNGQQVVLPGIGHTGTFFAVQPEASSRLINSYFDTGKVDTSLYQPQTIDFNAASNFGKMAKVFLGLAVALAILTVLSLLWMAWRVHMRGRFGPKASAVLRSAYPIILGLGGLLLGTLIVLATMRSVPIDDDLPVALSCGLPAGLGIFLAWVHRDWSTKTKTTGVAAAIGGGLIGAWLGFNAASGLPAIATAILGAAVGANLILLAVDITWDRSNHRRFAVRGEPSAPTHVSGADAQPESQPAAVEGASARIQQSR
jgi:pimeloyl-ACP methyl ester carboxylesterase